MYTYADLVGYWPFDEGSGKVAQNVSGNGNDRRLINTPEWVEGKDRMALRLVLTQALQEAMLRTHKGTIENFGATDFLPWHGSK